jgi:gliding motility-associated-like protein
MPSNGDGTFAYAWEESLDNISWSNAGGIDSLIDYYKYGFFNSTKYFRRIVRSGYLDCCKDTSNSVKVTVQPEIQNNNIVSNQEICNAQTPAQLIQGSGTLTGGNGPFTFLWQQRPIDFLSWSDVTELGNQLNYQPSSLNKTTYYRRKAMSGVCISYSDSVTITALSLLTGNTLSGNPEVCEGKVPDIITGGNMSGGHPGDYRYVWQDSVSNGLWNNLSNAQDKDYIPNNLSQKTYFRRIVKSGDNDCCVSTSDPFAIIINLLPIGIFECHDTAICQGNNINAKLTITSGTAPFEAKLTEGTYQETITGLPQGLSNINFIPRQTGTYSVFSITDNKGCLAVSKDGSMKIRIVAVPKVVAGESAIVEGKTHQLVEISNISIGRWSTELPSTFQPSDTTPNAIVTVEKCGTHHFIWKETNEFCWDTASVEIIFWMRYTGFSPNNDGFNDYFVIEGLDNIRKELIVVNRWGNEVYSSDNYENNWDGTNQKGKPLPDDTYYYILKINGYKVYKGFIVIRR